MKFYNIFCIIICMTILCACEDHSPEHLKKLDEAKAACAAKCAPRQVETANLQFCSCVP